MLSCHVLLLYHVPCYLHGVFMKQCETVHQIWNDGENQTQAMKICRLGMNRSTSFTIYYYTGSIASASLVMLIMVLTLRMPGMLFISPMSGEPRWAQSGSVHIGGIPSMLSFYLTNEDWS